MDYIFGYGSLIWKPPPHWTAKRAGYIKGFTRRFAQSSNDHRGTVENPGRVVTLIPSTEWLSLAPDDPFQATQCYGVVYTIDPAYAQEVKDYLDYREKDGYTLQLVDVFGQDPATKEEILVQKDAKVYVGHSSNESFVGPPLSLQALVDHIYRSVGPSGPNKVYVSELALAVQALGPDAHDEYLEELHRRLLLKQTKEKTDLPMMFPAFNATCVEKPRHCKERVDRGLCSM